MKEYVINERAIFVRVSDEIRKVLSTGIYHLIQEERELR